MVDLLTIVDAVVAGAVLVLAAAVYWSAKQNQGELKKLAKQSLTVRAQQTAILSVKHYSIDGNEIVLEIENVGSAPATYVGLRIAFHPALPHFADRPDETGKPVAPEQAIKLTREGIQVFLSIDLDNRPLKYNGTGVRCSQLVKFLVNPARTDSMLLPAEAQVYRVSPLFLIESTSGEQWMKPLTVEDLVKFGGDNSFHHVAIDMDVVGKDLTENLISGGRVTRFIFDMNIDKTLEEAYQRGKRPYFYPVDMGEMIQEVGWMSKELYDKIRTYPYLKDGKGQG